MASDRVSAPSAVTSQGVQPSAGSDVDDAAVPQPQGSQLLPLDSLRWRCLAVAPCRRGATASTSTPAFSIRILAQECRLRNLNELKFPGRNQPVDSSAGGVPAAYQPSRFWLGYAVCSRGVRHLQKEATIRADLRIWSKSEGKKQISAVPFPLHPRCTD
jgi:hypothetical protein